MNSEESLSALKNDLLVQNWNIIYHENDVSIAYDTFLCIFKDLYDKNCPVRKIKKKTKPKDHPWITRGLQNACRRMNTLYKVFIRQRTEEGEIKYKKYKNNK